MKTESLINRYFDRLNDNDLIIWRYIKEHRDSCCRIAIDALAKACNVSRTTVSRFTQKLGFQGFREFKLHLKQESEIEEIEAGSETDRVCESYIHSIRSLQQTDLSDLCGLIAGAKRLFVFGTGETQLAAGQMLKRVFLSARRFVVVLHGKTELYLAMEEMGTKDLMIFISLSGETEPAVSAAKTLRAGGIPTLSVTALRDNTLSRLCNRNLYIPLETVQGRGLAPTEICAPYFHLIEILYMKYLTYLRNEAAGSSAEETSDR